MGVVKDLRCFYADGDYSSKPANNRLYAKERVEGLVLGAGEEETIRERERERTKQRPTNTSINYLNLVKRKIVFLCKFVDFLAFASFPVYAVGELFKC